MTHNEVRFGLPHVVRIKSSNDFGRVVRAASQSRLALGRGVVSVGVNICSGRSRARVGFTVGKHHVPRSVDRVLAKRVMRDVARHELPRFQKVCEAKNVGLDIVLRIRRPLGLVGKTVSVSTVKATVRQSTKDCIAAIVQRIEAVLLETDTCSQKS